MTDKKPDSEDQQPPDEADAADRNAGQHDPLPAPPPVEQDDGGS